MRSSSTPPLLPRQLQTIIVSDLTRGLGGGSPLQAPPTLPTPALHLPDCTVDPRRRPSTYIVTVLDLTPWPPDHHGSLISINTSSEIHMFDLFSPATRRLSSLNLPNLAKVSSDMLLFTTHHVNVAKVLSTSPLATAAAIFTEFRKLGFVKVHDTKGKVVNGREQRAVTECSTEAGCEWYHCTPATVTAVRRHT